MMNLKKILMVTVACVFVLAISGCEKAEDGDYIEGTYFGSVETVSYGKTYVATAVVYVNESGVIKSVFLDSTYFADEKYTTKQVLGDAYGMKETSAANGVIEGGAEWYEQVAVIADKVTEEQGIDWVNWTDDTKTKLDGVSGVTISANIYIDAVSAALAQAK